MPKKRIAWDRRYRQIQGEDDNPLPQIAPIPFWRDADFYFNIIILCGMIVFVIWVAWQLTHGGTLPS